MITQCCVQALYALGKEHQHETEIAKSFERRKCNHRTAIDPNECLKDVIGELLASRCYAGWSWAGSLELGVADSPSLGKSDVGYNIPTLDTSPMTQLPHTQTPAP